MTAQEAQTWSNFAVFTPDLLPEGTTLRKSSVRREAPPGRVGEATAGRSPWSVNNPAAYRFELAGEERTLRVKEFLYDWAFPALDHLALWESPTRAVALDDEHVLWHGVDYLGHAGASARIARTMIELSVLEGTFAEQEIEDLYRSMSPVDGAAMQRISETSFAVLGYWARRPQAPPIAVPLGLWKIRQPDTIRPVWVPGRQAYDIGQAHGLPAALAELPLDSIATDRGTSAVAVEALYAGRPARNRELRLHLYRGTDPAAPERESHPGHHEVFHRHGREVHLAWIDPRFGPFDAVVPGGAGLPSFRILSSTGVGQDRAWFLATLDQAFTTL
ncbi:hypothetical protein AB0K48_19135 [Nonomuraea sp. NPDC055795]